MSKHGLNYESSNWPCGEDSKAKRRKRSRWGGSDSDKAFIPGMPTVIPQGLGKDQEEMYLLQLQIEEISRRLRTGDLGIPANPDERSPSPEPIYNSDGKRLNTREYRTRKNLEEERHQHIQRALSINSDYKPPPDYKPPVIRVNDKVMIPQEEHPDINFVGLLIGPRGNTLKNLEKETGAKIIIRGKGSVKEGKIGRKDGQPLPGEDEPLHAYVTASNPDNVKKAVDKINEIIRQGIEVPEGQNDLRRQQLRELAQLNGTLRENDALSKLKQIQQAQSIITNTIFCSVCGGTGHLSQDCKQKRPGDSFRQMNDTPPPSNVDKAKMDSEYMSLMAELGEGPPPPKQQAPPPRSMGGHMGGMHGRGDFNGPHGNSGHLGPPGGRGGPFGGPGMGPPGHMGPQGGHFNQGPPGQHGGPPTSQHQHLPPWQSGGPPKQLQLPPPNNPVPPLMSQNPVPSLMSQTSQPQQRPPTSQMPPGLMSQSSQPPPLVPPPVPAPLSSGAPWSQQQNITTTSQSQMGMPPPPPGMIAPPPPPPVSMASQSQPSFPWQQAMQQQQQQQQQGMGMPPPPPPTSSSATMSPWQQGHVGPVPPPPPNSMAPWQQSAPPGPVPPVAPPPPPPGSQGYNHNSGHNYGMPLGVPPPPPPN